MPSEILIPSPLIIDIEFPFDLTKIPLSHPFHYAVDWVNNLRTMITRKPTTSPANIVLDNIAGDGVNPLCGTIMTIDAAKKMIITLSALTAKKQEFVKNGPASSWLATHLAVEEYKGLLPDESIVYLHDVLCRHEPFVLRAFAGQIEELPFIKNESKQFIDALRKSYTFMTS